MRAYLELILELAYSGHPDGREVRLEMIRRYAEAALKLQETTSSELLDALKAFVEDSEARWDMHDKSTNPGIVENVKRAKAIILRMGHR